MPFDNIVSLDNENGSKLNIKIEGESKSGDVTVYLPMGTDKPLTKGKYNKLLKEIKEFSMTQTEDKMIEAPGIESVEYVEGGILVTVTPFFSPIILEPACCLLGALHIDKPSCSHPTNSLPLSGFRPGTDEVSKLDTLLENDKYQHTGSYFTKAAFNVDTNTFFLPIDSSFKFVDGCSILVIAKYVADGIYSKTASLESTYRKVPMLQSSNINISVTQFDLNTGLCSISATATLTVDSSVTGSKLEHSSTDWIIEYKDQNNSFVKVKEILGDTSNLTSINLNSYMFNPLEQNKEYYISCRYNYKNTTNSMYKEVSTKFTDRYKFNTPTAVLSPVTGIISYPNYITSGDPEIAITSTLTIDNGITTRPLTDSDIKSVVWRIFKDEKLIKEEASGTSWKLPKNTLKPKTNYKLTVAYITKSFGRSEDSVHDLITHDFVGDVDGLSSVVTKSEGYCYFGELPYERLTVDDIRYRGFYKPDILYNKLDEVNKDGELYVCIKKVTSPEYNFDAHFKSFTSQEGRGLYKSAIPTISMLFKKLGLPLNSLIKTSEETGYLKLQLTNGNVAYITKLPVISKLTINDLIALNLYHPYHRTIRLGKWLYYPRLLIEDYTTPYDPIQSCYDNLNYYDNYGIKTTKHTLSETKILLKLIDGTLSNYSISGLELPNLKNDEVVYSSNISKLIKLNSGSSGFSFNAIDIDNFTRTDMKFRLVLERIQEENLPMNNISNKLPGNNELTAQRDFYSDTAYLGYVDGGDFLTSNTIKTALNLPSGTVVDAMGWYKFYQGGLIHYVSDGLNLKNIDFNTLREHNAVYIHPTVNNDKGSIPTTKLGKVTFGNLLYNVSLPQVTNESKLEEFKVINGTRYDIFNVQDPNVDLNLSGECSFSLTMMTLLLNKTPLSKTQGYKGTIPTLEYSDVLKSIGSGLPSSKVLTCNTMVNEDVIEQYSTDLYKITKTKPNTQGEVILCLTIPAVLEK